MNNSESTQQDSIIELYERHGHVFTCTQTSGQIGSHQYMVWSIESPTYPFSDLDAYDFGVNPSIHDYKAIGDRGVSWISTFDCGNQLVDTDGCNIENLEDILDNFVPL